jgi:hypothetical protein
MTELYIYTLSCPITKNIRYVGQSVNPKTRYRRHISDGKKRKDHKSNWIRSLLEKNLKPILDIIYTCNESNVDYYEKYYIDEYKKLYDLTNSKEGGKAYKMTQEIKDKIRETLKGRKPPIKAGIAFAEYKSIKIECYKDEVLIGTFNSIKECCVELNLNRSKVSMVLNNLRPHHKGYNFKAV